jgi:L-threonylcarbamoyladenylate synthase
MSYDGDNAFELLPIKLQKEITRAVKILRSGGVVAYPTDTVYGLGCDIYDSVAVTRVYAVKGRPISAPFPVLISAIEQVDLLAAEISPFARTLMQKFWPGGLTIVFHKSPGLETLVLAGSHKIGLRIPGHPVPLLLVSQLGRPIVGTSANLHQKHTALSAAEIRKQLSNNVDLVIDGGPCRGGTESTVVDVTCTPPKIIRRGMIPEKAIMRIYGK